MRTPRRISGGAFSAVFRGDSFLPPVAAFTVHMAGIGSPPDRREVEKDEAGKEGENDEKRIHCGLPFHGGRRAIA